MVTSTGVEEEEEEVATTITEAEEVMAVSKIGVAAEEEADTIPLVEETAASMEEEVEASVLEATEATTRPTSAATSSER